MKWVWGTPLTLQTENYILQSLDTRDVPEDMVQWFADPEIMRYMNDPMNLDRQKLAKRFSRLDNKRVFGLVIYARDIKKPIGLMRIFVERSSAKAETSILIGNKDYWGRNVVLEVRERVIRFLFTAMKLNKITGSVRARNFPALFNYTKQGFKREGILKEQVRGREGDFEDVILFGLLQKEWLKNQENIPASEASS
ncbi:MAG: GNAT family protein [Sneathiella sp.]